MKQTMKLSLKSGLLHAESADHLVRAFAFPAVALSLKGRRIEAVTLQGKVKSLADGSLEAHYSDGGIDFSVTVTPGSANWFFKQVTITTKKELPTPDYVDVDFQQGKAPGLRRCGYMITDGRVVRPGKEEEGGGVTPGCGYPLIGKDFFTGLEHPAAFNTVEELKGSSAVWHLRQHPVWNKKSIHCVRAVMGMGKDPKELFYEYLESIRLPKLKAPLISFCSFWSDPYLGNYEYLVDQGNYISLVNAFTKMGLRPDVYTLDAGWQDRKSFFDAKPAFGGNKALKEIGDKFRAAGSDLSVWVSHNGPMGMDWDFLQSKGIAVGGGQSACYCGDHYAVMMDPKLEKALTKRFCELCSPKYDVKHFKIDWDNDCATTPEFAKLYPTRDHVREGSIDAMSRIADAMRKTRPDVITRNGWWPSPWWLTRANHVFLADSGDSEYCDFPALSQRDSAANHRDLLYYCEQIRDNTPMPLDAYDNHEFPHARRNPFVETPGVWSNTCVWAMVRGASYLPMTLQPESLEPWQAEILKSAMEFYRKNAKEILTGRSRMVGGNPARGDIYGFLHPGKDGECFLALRNSSPMPQEFKLPAYAKFYAQLYPDFRTFKAGGKVTFAPHEVKILAGSAEAVKNVFQSPVQCRPAGRGRYQVFFPSSCRPGVAEVYQLPKLEPINPQAREKKNSLELEFGIRAPYRLRNFKMIFKISGPVREKMKVRFQSSRYDGWTTISAYAIPVAELPFGVPGGGEAKNPDLQPPHDTRYFAADLPQGGEGFFNLELTGGALKVKDLELWITGFEAPAKEPEPEQVKSVGFTFPLPYPDGFPLSLRLW